MQDVPQAMLLLAQGAQIQVSYLSWAVLHAPEMQAVEEAVPPHRIYIYIYIYIVVIVEWFANSYYMYFGEIIQIPLTDYFEKKKKNLEHPYNFSNIFHFFQKKFEEIGIFQFLPDVSEEIYFFWKKNKPAWRHQAILYLDIWKW